MSLLERQSILVPIDFSEASLEALRDAISLAESPALVHAVHVLPDLRSEADYLREAMTMSQDEREARARATLIDMLAENGAEAVDAIVCVGSAGEEITRVARELGCDLIVMPTHGRKGVSRLLLGSVAERVLRLAHCPVLVTRGPADGD